MKIMKRRRKTKILNVYAMSANVTGAMIVANVLDTQSEDEGETGRGRTGRIKTTARKI